MDTRPLLIFDLDGARFALDAGRVRESLWLPELAPVEEAPPWVVGLFSLRGEIVPVADLRLRFGHPARPYRTSDQVVVVETERQTMGVIVSAVVEVIDLSIAKVQPPPRYDDAARGASHLVSGEARVGEGLVTLLDLSRLNDQVGEVSADAVGEHPVVAFCPDATAEDRALFHARALALRQIGAAAEGEYLGLAVMELGGECFGVELAAVREFCDVGHVSPIPCCPPHILGAISLRGELLTLIDPREALNLPLIDKPSGKPSDKPGAGLKAVVARHGELTMALAVDAVHDVVYSRREEVRPPPLALRERYGGEIIGTAPYGARIMTVLDLPALLAREEWIVNQEV
jgi:purine-binding chemotaxis protein CheW